MIDVPGSRPILVVSADPSRSQPVAEALRSAGAAVAVEEHGAAAAARLGNGATSLVVLDLSLPELDVPRLCEALGDGHMAPEPLEVVERRQIAAMLRYTGGNRRKAAQLLGLARSTLLAKIRRFGLEPALTPAGV
ncbi:MAG TPA: helix-turn-helix domain-containing protein [Gemmatimonadales bacterium]|jgi:DNA-binding NtrC family response regulator|nr:helix-turn-helix domain-containing protein [Gemmatimonadales bacterium]